MPRLSILLLQCMLHLGRVRRIMTMLDLNQIMLNMRLTW